MTRNINYKSKVYQIGTPIFTRFLPETAASNPFTSDAEEPTELQHRRTQSPPPGEVGCLKKLRKLLRRAAYSETATSRTAVPIAATAIEPHVMRQIARSCAAMMRSVDASMAATSLSPGRAERSTTVGLDCVSIMSGSMLTSPRQAGHRAHCGPRAEDRVLPASDQH